MKILRWRPGALQEPDLDDETWAPYAAALREMPVPPRQRDFTISASQAAALASRPADERKTSGLRRTFGRALAPAALALLVVGLALPRLLPAPASSPMDLNAAPAVAPTAEPMKAGPNEGVSTQAGGVMPCPATDVSSSSAPAWSAGGSATPPAPVDVSPSNTVRPSPSNTANPGDHSGRPVPTCPGP